MNKINTAFRQYVNDNYQVDDKLLIQIKNNLQFQTPKKHKLKYLKYSLSFCTVVIICLISFLIFQKNQYTDKYIENSNKDAYHDINNNLYDVHIGFQENITYNNVKTILDRYGPTRLPNHTRTHPEYVILQFAIRDNTDVIIIDFVDGDHLMIIESNLPYSFNDIITQFELKSKTKLTEKFLNSDKSGIEIKIINNQFTYRAKIKGVDYFVTEEDLI